MREENKNPVASDTRKSVKNSNSMNAAQDIDDDNYDDDDELRESLERARKLAMLKQKDWISKVRFFFFHVMIPMHTELY